MDGRCYVETRGPAPNGLLWRIVADDGADGVVLAQCTTSVSTDSPDASCTGVLDTLSRYRDYVAVVEKLFED